ncbi:hypothetical protein [Photobacterium leiognathi]|uniref:hypothetical protein n=1 Tax=Photobacterium leiognathi TaxID=553611 RepID=UPI003AF3AFB7
MCTTKSKLLSVLAEFNMEGGPIIPCGIFIFDEEQYPFSESDWSLEFTDHHNADGASTIYVNRKTQTLVLVYDSDVNVQYEDTTYGFCYECLVFGDIEFIKGFCDNGIDVNEHSLWYKHECDIPYIEFLCPHLVKDMVFEDDLATNKDVGENKIDSEGLLSSKVAYETYKDLVSLGIDCEFIEIDKQLPLSFDGYCSHVNFPSKVVIKGVPDKEGTKDYVLGVGLDGSTPNYWLCDKSTYVDYDDLMKLSGQLSVELYFHLTSSNVAVHKFIDFDEGLVEFCENGTCMDIKRSSIPLMDMVT